MPKIAHFGHLWWIFAILGLNVAGMNVTRLMSAVTRTVFEACRTLCIWIFALFMFYGLKWHGEKWTNWSFMQAGGFILLVLGTFIYNEILKLPCIEYDASSKGLMDRSDDGDNGGGAFDDAGDHHAAVAVAAQDYVVEFLRFEHPEDVGDMGVEIDVRRCEMHPFAETGQRRCVHLVPRVA